MRLFSLTIFLLVVIGLLSLTMVNNVFNRGPSKFYIKKKLVDKRNETSPVIYLRLLTTTSSY